MNTLCSSSWREIDKKQVVESLRASVQSPQVRKDADVS